MHGSFSYLFSAWAGDKDVVGLPPYPLLPDELLPRIRHCELSLHFHKLKILNLNAAKRRERILFIVFRLFSLTKYFRFYKSNSPAQRSTVTLRISRVNSIGHRCGCCIVFNGSAGKVLSKKSNIWMNSNKNWWRLSKQRKGRKEI